MLDTSEALALAEEKGLDLVEVAPTARPPVCRIMDYKKNVFEEKKKQNKKKKKNNNNTERLSVRGGCAGGVFHYLLVILQLWPL